MTLDPNALLAPLSGGDPAGEDLGFDDIVDRIREARRADDPQLAQGDWQIALKAADWRQAAELAEQALRERTKDLQIGVWLAEAWIHRHGLPGAAPAFSLLQGLLTQYWDGLYPRVEDGDLEERASKLAWLDTYGSAALRQLPLAPSPQAVTLNDWHSSREVDNLARQNRDAYDAALADGKMTGDAFDAALAAAGVSHVRDLLAEVHAAQAAFDALRQSVDQAFGQDAPGLSALAETLKRLDQVLARAGQALGLDTGAAPAASAPASASSPASAPTAAAAAATAAGIPAWSAAAPASLATKADAVRQLGDIADFFTRTEPHSPVASLLQRAVAWADMPLADWLQEVVRDDSVLAQIRDRIGLPRQND